MTYPDLATTYPPLAASRAVRGELCLSLVIASLFTVESPERPGLARADIALRQRSTRTWSRGALRSPARGMRREDSNLLADVVPAPAP
jgi:hypothetical protein